MRFAKLVLERYGRFEDCELSFRTGQPDLHVIYGPNEAGKTTSMAAVSDLLFGFGTTSPYKFLFDYPLLRIGAVLEEDGQRLPIRRRKANAGSLVGADDKPIDEAPLSAMLRGQNRDTFRLSFSLDQEGLRKGGQAMVQARDDLGQALFAAGSNLTSVTAEVRKLEEEADAIWGKRASNKRTYTAAEREFREKTRAVRDHAMKPRDWSDARNSEASTRRALTDLEQQRDRLSEEARKLQRLRRIGAFVRTRSSLLEELAQHSTTIALTTQMEAGCDEALAALTQAERDREAAQTLKAEAGASIALISLDETILAAAERLEQIMETKGAVAKGTGDLQRLKTERELLTREYDGLRRDAGLGSETVPGKVIVNRLREIAKRASDARAALGHIATSEIKLRSEILESGEGADSIGDDDASDLRAAVDGARAAGDDVDRRCAEAVAAADRARRDAAVAVDKLQPWTGSLERLATLVPPGDDELQQVISGELELAGAITEESDQRRRLVDEAAVLLVEIDGLQGAAGAVSEEDLSRTRSERDHLWESLRSEIALGELGPNAPANAATLDVKLGEADHLADRRFTKAEDSGRLAHLIVDRKAKLVQATQADERAKTVAAKRDQLTKGWSARLTSAHLPDLEPGRMRVWLTLRDTALEQSREAERLLAASTREHDRRNRAVTALMAALSIPGDGGTSQDLSVALARASAALAEMDAEAARLRETALERKRIKRALADLAASKGGLEQDVGAAAKDWAHALQGWTLAIEIHGSELRLGLFDDARVAIDKLADLDRRIEGIERDTQDFATSVEALAVEAGIVSGTSEQRVDALRKALLDARATQTKLRGFRDDLVKRQAQENEAGARVEAARKSLAPAMVVLGATDIAAIGLAIDASRAVRRLRDAVSDAERQIEAAGDGYDLQTLLDAFVESDPDQVSTRSESIERELADLNAQISDAASAHGDARRAFLQLESSPAEAIDAATDAASALAEMAVQAEDYILRRVQAVTLRWAIERYREEHQDPMLERASAIFSRLTLARYSGLRVDHEAATPRLLGVSNDGRSIVEVGAMSEGTTDQLFLALRLAAVEQSVSSGVRLPFLADDLFVNFDDDRARAGFEVLAELARSTQVLFFTHHAHLAEIARDVVGSAVHSECSLA